MMAVLYDNRDIYKEILLDLPLREGIGTITQDVAKPHHPIIMINTPGWETIDTGLMVMTLDGVNEYLYSDNADTADLDFTSGDYSLGGWVYIESTGTDQVWLGRYTVSESGWELYFTPVGALRYLTLRHHHAAGSPVRTGAYSLGWAYGSWWFFGISRSGEDALHYRNGVSLTVVTTTGGLIDPESNNTDLVIGVRTSKDTHFAKVKKWRWRIWPKAITAAEWLTLYELEKGWFA